MNILGVRIDNYNLKQAEEKVCSFLKQKKQCKIFTPNPEMLVCVQKDEYFKKVLNSGDINLCDGRGIQIVSKEKLHRIPGSDFVHNLCSIAQDKELSVFILGGANQELAKKAGDNLKIIYPNLKKAGTYGGFILNDKKEILELDIQENNKIIRLINDSKADALFVCLGMGRQEKWIYQNLSKMPNVKIAGGFGGVVDFLAGNIKRAPKWIRQSGLEWLYRLVKQPSRLPRIFNATIKFLYIYYFKKSAK